MLLDNKKKETKRLVFLINDIGSQLLGATWRCHHVGCFKNSKVIQKLPPILFMGEFWSYKVKMFFKN